MKRIYYKDKTFKDVKDNQTWEYENDPNWQETKEMNLEAYVKNTYWENPADAIGEIRKFITINKGEEDEKEKSRLLIRTTD